jgi:parallel beta-helix repeat protein
MLVISIPVTIIGGIGNAYAQAGEGCISYDQAINTITITCPSSNMTMVHDSINNEGILKQESSRIWLLTAALLIEKNSSLTIDSSDTLWLKLGTSSGIISYGSLTIDSVRITSWDSTRNNFAITDGTTPRPYITMWEGGNGKMDITNSEISHLGYHTSHKQGLAYYSGNGSRIDNNNIHDMWYGFYSNAVSFIDITNNHIHDNEIYGLDPHTGTHDLQIRNNTVHDIRKGIGIICSHDCYNIMMEDNVVYNSEKVGLMFSRTTTNSTMRNNIAYNNGGGISIHDLSSNNTVYNNTVYGNGYGVKISKNSGNNELYDNNVLNSTKYSVCLVEGTHNDGNRIFSNNIDGSSGHGVCIFNGSSGNLIESNTLTNTRTGIYVIGPNALNNTFKDNEIIDSTNSILLKNDTSTNFVSNSIDGFTSASYFLVDSTLNLTNTTFSGDRIVGDGKSNVVISNSDPAVISGSDTLHQVVNKDGLMANMDLINREDAIVSTVPMYVESSDGSPVSISAVQYNLGRGEPSLRWNAQTESTGDILYRIGNIQANTTAYVNNSDGETVPVIADPLGYIEYTTTQKFAQVSYIVRAQFSQLVQNPSTAAQPPEDNIPAEEGENIDNTLRVKEVGLDESLFGERPGYHNMYFGCDLQSVLKCDPLSNKFKSFSTSAIYSTVTTLKTLKPQYTEGKFDQALELTASYREAVEITNNPSLHSESFTIAFWIKPAEKPEIYSHLISHTNFAGTRGWFIENSNDPDTEQSVIKFGITTREGGLISTSEIPVDGGRFTHIAVTFNGSEVRLYRDGVQVHGFVYDGSYAPDPGLPLKIGSASYSSSTNRWSGTLDDFVLFNRALDNEEISNIVSKNSSFGKITDSSDGVIAYYPFDGETLDKSGNNNHGTQSTLLASMAFAPDGRMFFSEKNTGKIMIMKDNRILEQPFASISDLYVSWEQGLLGITLDPKFTDNHFVYLYYSAIDDQTDEVYNKVVRFTDNNGKGENMVVVLDRIPGIKGYHSGGALAFNPADDKLYITVGDATEHDFAQDPNTYLGKVLRINRDGTFPQDNPFANSPVYTVGSRNMFGLAFDKNGYGIMTENGEGAYDEVNLIQKGANYGFPSIQKPNQAPELTDPSESMWPLRSYRITYAPTQAIYYTGDKFPELKGKYIFGTFTGDIFALSIDKNTNQIVEELRIDLRADYFTPIIGIAQSPSGDIYFGSYEIFKLESSGYQSRQESMFPLTVSLPSGVKVKNISVNTETFSLTMDIVNGNGTLKSYDVGIRAPRLVIDGVFQVLSENGSELQHQVIPRMGTSGAQYNDLVVNYVASESPDSRI